MYLCEYSDRAYRNAGITLPDTQLYFAVQVDITSLARELKCVEREVVGCFLSIALHLHHLVSRVRAAAQRQESTHDWDWPETTRTSLIKGISLSFTH